jgi:hypothetical protein
MNRTGWSLALLIWCGSAHCAFESLYRSFPVAAPVVPDNSAGPASASRGLSISIDYTPAPFGLTQLQYTSFGITSPVPDGHAHLSILHSGFSLYSELCVRGAVLISLGSVRAGMGLSWCSLSLEGYGTTQSLGIDFGMEMDVAAGVRWNASALNVNGATLGHRQGELPRILSTGIAYSASPRIVIELQVTKDVSFPPETIAGFAYVPLDGVVLSCGLSTNPSLFTAGLSLEVAGIGARYAVITHTVLGLTHRFGLVFVPSLW